MVRGSVNLDNAFDPPFWTDQGELAPWCASTSCGVGQKDANGVCIFTTLAPSPPTLRPTPTPIVDAAHRLSGVSAALLVLALAA